MAEEDKEVLRNMLASLETSAANLRLIQPTRYIKKEKKYQVFVSSTYLDLRQERQAVSRAILELGHFPAGMELFPASDQDQLDFIKKVIDDCDYYIVILGGKYGSKDPGSGLGYTESEYDYAVQEKKPVIALIHKDINKLSRENTEIEKERIDALERFRAKLQAGRLVKFWSDESELKSQAILSLVKSFSDFPQQGWSRDAGPASSETLAELEEVRRRLDREQRIRRELHQLLEGYHELSGSQVELRFTAGGKALTLAIPAEEAIREFAAPLRYGFSTEDIYDRLAAMLIHKFSYSDVDIPKEAVENLLLFLEVFEIATVSEDDIRIRQDKLHLLKAAFRKPSVIESQADEEIPF